MKQSRKDFIIEAHDNACNDWRNRIEKEFPKLFKKHSLEVGEWYKREDYLMVWNDGKDTYGFFNGSFGKWAFGKDIKDELILATEKEVEQALIKEAKKRGFKKGVVVVSKGYTDSIFDGKFRFGENCNDALDGFGTGYIFKKGVWATIKETITKEQAEKELGKTILN
jgi:hypothetical protein